MEADKDTVELYTSERGYFHLYPSIVLKKDAGMSTGNYFTYTLTIAGYGIGIKMSDFSYVASLPMMIEYTVVVQGIPGTTLTLFSSTW